jgi:phenylalanyl-tRNA synthetase alpha chain
MEISKLPLVQKRVGPSVFDLDASRNFLKKYKKPLEGPLIETEFWNFDALFQPQDHPARDWFSTFTLSYPKYGKLPKREIVERVKACHENGWKTGSTGWRYKWSHEKASRLMPRAHGTCLSARTLASLPEIPGKYFAIAKCFRPDVIDPMHHIEFNQVEGIVLGESLTFKHLLGVLKMFAEEIAGAKEVRFIPDYYPFTECSVQTSCKHPALGWIEIGGAGIFREEVTYPLGIKVPVIAWGLGIDRLAMFKLNINDIRELLYSRNLDWLRKVPILKR